MWHANGSVKMGKPEDQMACVDSDFKVIGLESLRVVDLSVCPFTPKYVDIAILGATADRADRNGSNHTQAHAYLIGWMAARKLNGDTGEEEMRYVP